MVKILKIIVMVIILGGLVVPWVGCASKSDAASASENQAVTVERGNLTIDITAAGNLALSQTEDLAFEVAGTVVEVSVKEGDSVKEGQELAKLDTTEWDKQLRTLEKSLVTAQRNLTTKERALTTAEANVTTRERALTRAEANVVTKQRALTAAERQVTTKELAVRQAQLNLRTAEYNLSEIADVKKAQDNVDDAEYALKFAQSMLSGDFGGGVQLFDVGYWSQLLADAKAELAAAQDDLAEILNGSSVQVTTDVALQVAKYQLQVEQSQMALGDAQIAVGDAEQAVQIARLDIADAEQAVPTARLALDDARQAVTDARLDIADAGQTVQDAQSALDEAKSLSPIIKAPFAGFIPKINVQGGDEVLKGTVAMQLADPSKFEAEIMVSEMDIPQVKLGGTARVQLDALSGLTLPATVTHISPTATIQQGVVNYKVTVEVASMEAVTPEQQALRQDVAQNIPQGELPERLQQAIEEGRITQEQVEEMMKQRQQAQGGQSGQTPAAIPQNFQLREGLTVTVSIVVDDRSNVLLVPNSAITRRSGQTYVKVVSPGGTFEEREIQTGISDFQYTEVISGLSEGEQVSVPQGTATTPATSQPQRPPGGMFIPGVGGMR